MENCKFLYDPTWVRNFTFGAGRAWEAGELSMAGDAESDDVLVGFGFGVS